MWKLPSEWCRMYEYSNWNWIVNWNCSWKWFYIQLSNNNHLAAVPIASIEAIPIDSLYHLIFATKVRMAHTHTHITYTFSHSMTMQTTFVSRYLLISSLHLTGLRKLYSVISSFLFYISIFLFLWHVSWFVLLLLLLLYIYLNGDIGCVWSVKCIVRCIKCARDMLKIVLYGEFYFLRWVLVPYKRE